MRIPCLILMMGATWLMAQDPVDFRGWLNQGVTLYKNAQYPEAVAAFERAAAMDASNPVARLYLGTAYMQQYIPGSTVPENLAKAQRADAEFRRVLEMEPQNRTALSSIASLNLNQKKWDEALGWYDKLIAVDPQNADAYYTLGFVAWSKWYPVYAQARKDAGLRPEAPGPLPDASVRQQLNAQYGPMLQAGIDALDKAMELRPQYDDAMAYINLLIRERADLRDSAAEWRQDINTADEWVQKALAAKKAKAEARSTASSGPMPPPPPPPPPGQAPAMPSRIRIGGNVQAAKLVNRVAPAATSSKGDVVLSVVIDRQGNVQDIRALDGNPALFGVAIDAVRQWRYQPTLLNGVPVEVETQVNLSF